MKHPRQDNCFYILVEKGINVRNIGPHYLLEFLGSGYKTYPTYEEAEAGRQNGDAYDNPNETRVIGVSITTFLPRQTTRRTSTPSLREKSKSTYRNQVKKGVKNV